MSKILQFIFGWSGLLFLIMGIWIDQYRWQLIATSLVLFFLALGILKIREKGDQSK